MRCSRCQHENETDAKFCEECATPLARACTKCGRQLSPAAKFCPECAHPTGLSDAPPPAPRFSSPESYTPRHLAEKILTSKAALEGERKQVTVLFADLKGSMELLADRDPEEARKLLDPVLERMMEAVHRYEGTVNQVMGDGIMALFGAPLAHEDHAVRACYAALRMLASVGQYAEGVFRSHGVPIQIRVGLNSGEVVVRAIGSDLHMDYTAVGQTTHLAARMEQMAMPGSILITAATLALAEGYVGVKPLGPVPVKGLNELIEVFELTGAGLASTRLQAAAARGLTRFVGREAEVHAVREGLERARGGHGQLIALIGEPGVGKSRLVWEFTHHSHQTHGWLVLESSSVSYGKNTAFLPVINLLKTYFQIEERDDARKIRERVTGKLLTLDQALAAILPAFLALLDVSADDPGWQALEPSQRRHQTLDAVKRLVLRESQIQPLLLVFEDLHWIDGESQALLDSLVEGLPSAHVLLLVNFRPEYEHRWGGKTYYTQLRLDPLPTASARELLQGLLGDNAGLEPLKCVLIERTEGNPFFLEENVRTLIETKVLDGERGAYRLARALPEIHVPATVQSILAARIDRLLPDEKRLLQSAAVVGKDVPFALLALVVEAPEEELRRALAHLQAAEFIYEARIFPDLEYTFKHALTHDVAYESLLHDRRRTLHAAVVVAIERLHAGRLAEHAEHLAHHARQAEIWAKAGRYLWEAGRKAFTRSANREAADYFEHAAAAIDRLPQTRETLEQAIDVRFELRTALQVLRAQDRQETCLADALTRAETLGDQRRLGYTLMFAGLRATGVEDLDEGLRLGDRALTIGRSIGDLGIQAGASCYLAITHLFAGRFAEAARLCEAAIALIPPERTHERFGQARMVSNLARGTLGNALGRQGRFSDGIAHAEEALNIARYAGQAYSLSSSLWELGVLHLLKGDHAVAAREIEQSIEVWRTIQAPAWNHPIQGLGLVYCRMGRVSEGIALIDGAPGGGAFFHYSAGAVLGEAYLLAGRASEAADQAQKTLARAREKGQRACEADALHLAGDVAAQADPPDLAVAEPQYRAAMALADELGMRPLVAHCHLGLGKLYGRTDKREQAQEHLASATAMYREMGMTYWLEKAEAEMRELG